MWYRRFTVTVARLTSEQGLAPYQTPVREQTLTSNSLLNVSISLNEVQI